jgi:hypothetical protein
VVDRAHVHETDLDAGTVRRGTRVVQPFAVHEHQHACGVEASQARPDLKGAGSDDGHPWRRRQRIARAHRRHLAYGLNRHRVGAQGRNLHVALAPRRGNGHFLLYRTELEFEVHRESLGALRDHDRPGRIGEANEGDSHTVAAHAQAVEPVPAARIRGRRRLLPGGDVQQADDRGLERAARAVGDTALDLGGEGVRHERERQQERKEGRTHRPTL